MAKTRESGCESGCETDGEEKRTMDDFDIAGLRVYEELDKLHAKSKKEVGALADITKIVRSCIVKPPAVNEGKKNTIPMMDRKVGDGKTSSGREFELFTDLGGRTVLCVRAAEGESGFGTHWIVTPHDLVEYMLRCAGLETD